MDPQKRGTVLTFLVFYPPSPPRRILFLHLPSVLKMRFSRSGLVDGGRTCLTRDAHTVECVEEYDSWRNVCRDAGRHSGAIRAHVAFKLR